MEPAWHFATPGSRPGDSGAVALRPGQPFGPYLLLDELGAGGMGAVYRARDGAGREVALKVIRGRLDERRRARFKREGELTSRLDHPGVVRVLGGGELQGVPFLVYDLVPGATSLAEAFRTEPLARRVELVRDAAAAVGYAHAQGVIHRDLKPDNILIDTYGRVRVADFGLGKGQESEALTQTGAVLGTLGYMSPEQLLGREADARSDVWALGVLLYEALCGRLPFALGSAVEVQARVLGQEAASPRTVDASVPPDLARVCLRALAKEPEARYPTGAELAAVLSAWLRGERIEATPRRRALLASVAVLALALGVAGWGLTRRAAPATAPVTATATATATPAGSPDAPSGVDREVAEREGARQWRAVSALSGRPKLVAAWRWLLAQPGHPLAAEVRSWIDSARRREPLLQVTDKRVGGNTRIAFLPGEDGVLGYARGVVAYDLDGQLQWQRWQGSFVHRVFQLRDGDWVFSNGGRLTRLTGDALPERWRGPSDQRYFALDPQERWVACVGSDGPVNVYRTSDGELLHALAEDSSVASRGLLATRAGQLVAVRAGRPEDSSKDINPGEGRLCLFDPLAGTLLATRGGLPPLNSGSIAEHPTRDELALGCGNGALLILDGRTLEERASFVDPAEGSGFLRGGAHPGPVGGVVYTRDGKFLYSGPVLGTRPERRLLKRWDAASGDLVDERLLPDHVFRTEVSPSGRLLGIAYDNGDLEVWIEALP